MYLSHNQTVETGSRLLKLHEVNIVWSVAALLSFVFWLFFSPQRAPESCTVPQKSTKISPPFLSTSPSLSTGPFLMTTHCLLSDDSCPMPVLHSYTVAVGAWSDCPSEVCFCCFDRRTSFLFLQRNFTEKSNNNNPAKVQVVSSHGEKETISVFRKWSSRLPKIRKKKKYKERKLKDAGRMKGGQSSSTTKSWMLSEREHEGPVAAQEELEAIDMLITNLPTFVHATDLRSAPMLGWRYHCQAEEKKHMEHTWLKYWRPLKSKSVIIVGCECCNETFPKYIDDTTAQREWSTTV